MSVDQFEPATDDGRFVDEKYGDVATHTTPTVHYVNEAGVPEDVMDELRGNRDIANQIEKWSQSLAKPSSQPSLDLFNRNKWDSEHHVLAQMSQCAWAVENDDILSTLADVLEGLSFGKCSFELYDDDQEDMWNQWAGEVDLDSRLREMTREVFKTSQVIVGLWWEQKVYSVRDEQTEEVVREVRDHEEQRQKEALALQNGEEPETEPKKGPGRGNRTRKKKFPVRVPTAFTIFEPGKVVPVGTLMFGRERFAYVADPAESTAFGQALRGDIVDPMVLALIERKYEPTPQDARALQDLGIDVKNLWLMNQDAVFRHTVTRAQYERFPSVRLKPILPILEMKQHLRASDRASLIGNTNFIVVITKGTDKHPAKPAEISNLQEQARVIARLPVLVGDHRLNVEIVSPALDNTLIESRWQVLDSRLVFTALRSFQPIVQGGNSSGGVSEMSRVVSQGLENRRHQLVRSLERFVFRKIMEANEGTLSEFPSLAFMPKRITLDFKADVMNAILKLRDRGDVSRETTLEEFDFDQDVEVRRRAQEKMLYDEVFQSGTPYGSPQMNPYAAPGLPGGPGDPEEETVSGPAKKSGPEGGRPPGSKDRQPRRRRGEGDVKA